MRLGDVARVAEDHQPLIGDAIIDGQPGLLLVVEKLPWANSLQMTAGVEDAIRQLEPGLPGIRFDTKVFQQANFVKLAIANLTQALVIGFILVVVILALFLFEWRMALISLLTIPISLVATMLVLYRLGATINTMTLAGLVIALGAVVDDAIIDVENITRRLRAERLAGGGRSTREVILSACLEVRSPIVYATLIIVAASVPVFLLAGLTGAFFRPLALSYTLAIAASMAVALTVTPALALLMLRGARIERRKSPLVGWLQKGYTAGLRRIIVRPVAAYATVVALSVLGVAVYPQLGQSLFPAFQEHDFLIHWVTPPGTSAAEMERSTTRISKELLAIPGVQSAGAHIGQALLGEEVAGVNLGEIWVSLAPNANYTAALDRIHAVANGYPGLFREVQTYLDERIEEVLTGGKEPIVVRVYGEDLKTLRAKSDQILDLVKSVPGVIDAHRDISTDVPQADVTVNLAKAEKYGLKPGDVRRDAATLVAGEEVGDIFRAGKAYDVVVWSPERTRHSFADIENLPIDLPSGGHIRLGEVATVALQPNPNAIDRQGDSRYLDVGAAVEGRDLGSVVNEIRQKLGPVQLARGYHVELLGEYAGAAGGAEPAARVGDHRRAAHPAAAPGLVPQLAARHLAVPDVADGAGRRRAGRLDSRRDHLAGLAGRVLHRVRHRRQERDPADQPLPASGGAGGDGVRPGARAPRRPGAAGPDPDDVAGHRAGAGPAGRAGHAPGARDRAPAGRGHPRRALYVHAAQPVRAAVAVPAVRPPAAAGGASYCGNGREHVMFARSRWLVSAGALGSVCALLAGCGSTGSGTAGGATPVGGSPSGTVASQPGTAASQPGTVASPSRGLTSSRRRSR